MEVSTKNDLLQQMEPPAERFARPATARQRTVTGSIGVTRKGGCSSDFPAAEQHANLHRLAPEIHLCFFGILIMLVDPFVRPEERRVLGWLGFAGAVFAIFAAIHVAVEHRGMAYGNLINTDDFSIFMHVIIIGGGRAGHI